MAITPLAKKSTQRKPKWSLKTTFKIFFSIVGLSTAIVMLISAKDLWLEFEIVTAVIALTLFTFYWWVLYHGVEFDDDDQFTLSAVPFDAAADTSSGLEFGSITAGGADDLGSLFFAFVLDIIVWLFLTFAFSLLLWLGFNGVILGTTLLIMPLFYIFRSSIRFVLRHSSSCHGDSMQSARFAAQFAIIKTSWLFLMIFVIHAITSEKMPSWLAANNESSRNLSLAHQSRIQGNGSARIALN